MVRGSEGSPADSGGRAGAAGELISGGVVAGGAERIAAVRVRADGKKVSVGGGKWGDGEARTWIEIGGGAVRVRTQDIRVGFRLRKAVRDGWAECVLWDMREARTWYGADGTGAGQWKRRRAQRVVAENEDGERIEVDGIAEFVLPLGTVQFRKLIGGRDMTEEARRWREERLLDGEGDDWEWGMGPGYG